jgi:hypothetical protein
MDNHMPVCKRGTLRCTEGWRMKPKNVLTASTILEFHAVAAAQFGDSFGGGSRYYPHRSVACRVMAKQPPSGDCFASPRSNAIKDVVTINGFTPGGDAVPLLHRKHPA